MKSEIQITNNADICHIDIEGTIGVPEEWQFEQPETRVATYEKFRDAVRRIEEIDTEEVIVNIRSTGGDVNDALLIHDALRSLGARITTRCYGYTASAATIIAQAAAEGRREISANALYLIHNAVCATEGNAAEMQAKVEMLQQTDARLAGVYATRAGRPDEEFVTLMSENNGNGRWLSPDQAVAAGLADIVFGAEEIAPKSLAQNLVRGWERLLTHVGLQPKKEFPSDRNILHFDTEQQEAQRSLIAMQEAQLQATATATKPREDPACNENIRSANDRAYNEDAMRMRKM